MAESNSQDRVVMRALPSPAESLPIELISRVVYFIAEELNVDPHACYVYQNTVKALSASSKLSKIWRVPSERSLYKQIELGDLGLSCLVRFAADDYRFSFVTNLTLFSFPGMEKESTQIKLFQFVSYLSQLKRVNIYSYTPIYHAVFEPMLHILENLEVLHLTIGEENGYIGDCVSIDGITSLLSLQELEVEEKMRKGNVAQLLGTSPRTSLKKLSIPEARSSQICSSLQYFPALEQLTIGSCGDLNLIRFLPNSLQSLSLYHAEKVIEQFKDDQRIQLTHLSFTGAVDFDQKNFNNLDYLPDSLIEFAINASYKGYGSGMITELKKYRKGDLTFKFIFSGFGRSESSDAVRETLWNDLVVEFERLGVAFERR